MTDEKYDKPRYINPLTDYGFKKLFGEKDIMTAFLTDLLNPSSPIEDIVFLDKEMAAETGDLTGVVYDLRCKTADGEEFLVEMQNKTQRTFSDRILFYLSRSISTQIPKGKRESLWNYKLSPVYGVFFTNFHLQGFHRRPIRTIQLKVDETGEVFSDKVKAFVLELPDYRGKSEDYPQTPIEYWLYNLANMGTMTTTLPFQNQQPIFQKMGGIAEIVRMNEEELNKYNVSLDTYYTSCAVMENERYEGRKAQNIENARKMKGLGLSMDIIRQVTNLSAEEINRL